MVPRKGPVPHAVRGVCFFLQELGYTRMVLKSDGEPSITGLVTAVQKNFQRQLIPRTSPVDDHASNGAVEAMVRSLEGLTRTSKVCLGRGSGSLISANFSDSAVVGPTSVLPQKHICRAIKWQNTV